jgi:hypothetical protein
MKTDSYLTLVMLQSTVTATFKVHLHRSDHTFIAGELLQGIVVIHDSQARNENLILEYYWIAHGADIHEVIDRGDSILIETISSWEAGITEVPFEFVVPNGPFSFKGTETFLDCEINLRFENSQRLQLLTRFYIENTFLRSEPDFGSNYKILKNERQGNVWLGVFSFPFIFLFNQFFILLVMILVTRFRTSKTFYNIILYISEILFFLKSIQFAFGNIIPEIFIKNINLDFKIIGTKLAFSFRGFSILNMNKIKVKIKLSQWAFDKTFGYDDSIFEKTLRLEIRDCKQNQTKFFETELQIPEKVTTTFVSENFEIRTNADIHLFFWGWLPWSQYRHMVTIYPKLLQPTDLFTSQVE